MSKEEKEHLRPRILDAARKLLIRGGIHDISMRKLGTELGVTAPSIYYHFKNKDDLVHSLIEEGFQVLYKHLSAAQDELPEEAKPLARIRANIRAFIDFGFRNPEYYEIMYMLHMEEMVRFPKEQYRRTRLSLQLGIDLYNQGLEAGELKRFDPELVTAAMAAMLHGYVSMKLMNRFDRGYDSEALLETMTRVLMEGIKIEQPEN